MDAGRKKLTYQGFIERARARHGDLYDYPVEGEYFGAHTKMTVICREPGHGAFKQRASNHLNGNGCPKCARLISQAAASHKHDLRARARHVKEEPFGALGGLYVLPFWS